MKTLTHIFLTLMTAIIMLACAKDVSVAQAVSGDAAAAECVQQQAKDLAFADECVRSASRTIDNREGDVPNPVPCFVEESESFNNAGRVTDRKARSVLLTGGHLSVIARRVRSVIHPASGGFAQCTTTPVFSLASRSYYIYVLRRIIR